MLAVLLSQILAKAYQEANKRDLCTWMSCVCMRLSKRENIIQLVKAKAKLEPSS